MKNILVLDDDASNLQVFAAILWSNGYNVLEASTAQEAFGAAQRTQPIDLVVTDVGLRGDVSGTEVAAELARNHDGLPVVFVTGTPFDLWDETDRQNFQGLRSSAVAILEKPFSPTAFAATVEQLLSHVERDRAANPGVREYEFSTR